MSMPESLVDQSLSGLLPAQILKTLFTLLTNSQTFTASQGGVATAIDPSPFAQEPGISFSYDATTQTQSVGFEGLIPDWRETDLKKINTTALFSSLLDAVQQQAQATLGESLGDILGVGASLVQYEAVRSPVATAIPVGPLCRRTRR